MSRHASINGLLSTVMIVGNTFLVVLLFSGLELKKTFRLDSLAKLWNLDFTMISQLAHNVKEAVVFPKIMSSNLETQPSSKAQCGSSYQQ
jgi:hypothetical protein